MTPVIVLSDAFVANCSSIWHIPSLQDYPDITPHDVSADMASKWAPYIRDPQTLTRYRAIPGTEDFCHVIGGLEKDDETGKISYDPQNHETMVEKRNQKVALIAKDLPLLTVKGTPDADTLIIGWGGTYGHLLEAVTLLTEKGEKIALAHFQWINPLPSNTEEILRSYKKIIVAELNSGQFAAYLRMKFQNLPYMYQINCVQGQPFEEDILTEQITQIIKEK